VIRSRVIASLISYADRLGASAEGSAWHLFGSVERNDSGASDIDVLVLCENAAQADTLRREIDRDGFELPIQLSLMTFEEAASIDAVSLQGADKIYPVPIGST